MDFHSSAAQPFDNCFQSTDSRTDSGTDSSAASNTALPRSSRSSPAGVIDTLLSCPSQVTLPPIGVDTVISQRHEVNPALALNLLQDIQTVVTIWQKQLRQIVKAIHLLCDQGPMVDGWLESSMEAARAKSEPDALLWRHGETEALLQQVAALERQSETAPEETAESRPAQYRLCSLDAEGKLQSQPCPPGQMAVVSTAIARYQKFKQLTLRKQAIEVKLQRAVNGLSGVRTDLLQ